MSKKKDLAGALRAQEEPEQGSQGRPASSSENETDRAKSTGRSGMVNIAGWFPVTVKFELEELRLARSRRLGRKVTFQELQTEAYNDLFKKYGRPEIAPSG